MRQSYIDKKVTIIIITIPIGNFKIYNGKIFVGIFMRSSAKKSEVIFRGKTFNNYIVSVIINSELLKKRIDKLFKEK